ncbi:MULTISPECIES: DUF6538 domain-containing protein [unclassified Brevundimonas]|jgi:integrase|uniref:DUF6538 domain-containing protein n=1 Tax=unclassified Brevundimonas TaxID=2622653 RepID=UPI000C4A00D5|nr:MULTISPECIES: DUF6538 domain-containing protein [unclassified Brevundimonas]MAL89151.1 hypothetical protein [Brevundimonas sp.]HAJ04155.1 hypothetical protein [Brevundimonas sp.]HAV49670.1 hypothetical protein [Brevundimonas sp.]|tara:strand:- start:28162 stop:29901 length:1740 start_codon:yes stop_codon:yes gene_type:complete
MAGRRPAHLARRGAVYFVRFRIPADLTKKLGMVEFRRSLQTRNSEAARIECLRATAWFRAVMEKLREMPNATAADFEEAARAYFSQLVADLDRPRSFPTDPHEFDHGQAYALHLHDERLMDLAEQLKRNEFDGHVHVHALALAELLGFKFDALTLQQQTQISRLAVRTEIAQSELFRHQITSPLERFETSDPLFHGSLSTADPGLQLSRPQAQFTVNSLKTAADDFIERKRAKGIAEGQIAELERALGWLQEVVGPETSLLDVTKEILRRFRTDLSRRDVTLRGRKVPFRHSLTDEPAHQIQFQTAIRYWGSVQAFFAWAYSEGLSPLDPAAGLLMDRPKSITKRSPKSFDTDELKRLFQTPLFAGHKSPKRTTEPGTCLVRDGRWWFVVLAMHSGARAGELCQLLPTDFVFDDAVPHWKLQLEDGENKKTKTLKTKTSIRDVPIHPRLLELGLREFVTARAKRRPAQRILYEFRLGTQGRTSAGATRFWTDYLKKFGLHSPGRATHVWRHTVADCLRENSVPDEDIGAFLGHSSGSQTSQYGSAQSLKRKRETILKLEYGFDVVGALGGPYSSEAHRS